MDSHSRSASPREPMRPQHRPPSPPASPGAFDNQAYQHDESDPNHNDSFASNGPQQNGHTKEPNGETKTLEAVNLELINLTPKNGNAKKKDVEVDMNASNPYDEYFVPVNEHKKYMRGEKLYVTADKRGDKGGCKRPLCWTLLGLVVAAIVAIIVLAATGVLFSNSPTPLEQYNTSVSSARALGGIGHVHHDHSHDHDNHDHEHDHSADHDHSMETTEHQHGPEPQSDEGHDPSMMSEETVDSSMYVPRTMEGELKVDSEEFTSALQDPESNEYKKFVANFADGVKRALFDNNSLDNGDNEITVEIVQLRKGSVIVTYRVHWKPKFNNEPTEDLMNASKLEAKLDDYLAKNNRMINLYHIAENRLTTRPVLDMCQINKNGCEYGCEFDETTLDFTCTCPHDQILDMANPKQCIPLLGSENEKSNEVTKGREFTVLGVNENPVTTKMVSEEENPTTESVHTPEHTFDWTETHHRMPETTAETKTDDNFSHIFGHPTTKEGQTETTKPDSSEENPVPEPEPKPEPEPTPEPEPKAEPEPTSEPEPKSESEPTPEPEPKSESEPTPEPEPKSEPEPVAEPEPAPEPQATAEPAPEPEPEPKSEPEPTSEPKSEPEPTPEPKAEPEPEAASTTLSPEHIALYPAFILPEEQQSKDNTSEPEPTTEPEPSQTTASETKFSSMDNAQATHTMETEDSQTSVHEAKPAAVTESSSITTVSNNNQKSEDQTNQSDNSEEKSILYTNEGKFEYKPSDDTEITTMRNVSEPNLINEPYEPKPEIISVLSINQGDIRTDDRHDTNYVTPTTEVTDWLEQQSHHSAKSDGTNQTEFEELLNNNVNKIMHESEQRSFKAFDENFVFETTTTGSTKSINENDSLDSISKDIVHPSIEITRKMEDATEMPVSILPVSEEISEGEISKIESTTKIGSVLPNVELETTKKETETESTLTENKETPESTTGSMITSILEEANSLDTNKSVPINKTTSKPETIQQFSINKYYQDSDGDKLIQVMENKPHSEHNETSTEREPEEGMGITFDAINMLYNRSSKSIENQPKLPSDNIGTQVTTEETSDTTESFTDSDWLSESVTEINYDEAMNKMSKHETTESSVSKIEEIMNHGLVKDDFETDYLSNTGPIGHKQEQDEMLHGMVHDYDSEDTRFKRVNKEATTNVTKEAGADAMDVKTDSGVIVNASVPVETTTVSEYIYKVAEKSIYDPDVTVRVHKETGANNSSSPVMKAETPVVNNYEPAPVTNEELEMNAEPAPVWEESDSEKYLTVKELPKKTEENTDIQHPVMIDVIQISSSTSAPTTMVPTNENSKNFTMNETDNSDLSENSQNTTQLSNLNVTIYEISSRSGNNSVLLAKPGSAQSAEYDDHETEMNPFLPEVENNKNLVKKLQEGHDLEPNNLTETQNENTEEHAITPSEVRKSSSNDSLAVLGKEAETNTNNQEDSLPITSEDDSSFNELLMNAKSHENETNITASNNMNTTDITTPATLNRISDDNTKMTKPEEKERLPVSTFLLDTDDLVTRGPTTTLESYKINSVSTSPTTSVPVPNDDGQFLSVVPIEEEQELEEQHKSENTNEEFNDISNLPKSDKRTLDATKFGLVINNEA